MFGWDHRVGLYIVSVLTFISPLMVEAWIAFAAGDLLKERESR